MINCCRFIGYGEVRKDPAKKNGELQIHLHQDYQGVGLGTAMMIILLKDAAEQRLHRVSLRAAAENHAAVNLFRKSGFHLEKVTQERYGDRLRDTLHMYRLLNTAS